MGSGYVTQWLIPGWAVAYVAWRTYERWAFRRRLPALLAVGAQVVDVRSEAEFASGHAPGSINLPLERLFAGPVAIDATRPVVVCCASGMRSAQARRWLLQHGFAQVFNAGSWRNLR